MSGREIDSISSSPLFIFEESLGGRVVYPLDQQDLLKTVDFLEFHFDDFVSCGLHHAADVTCFNGQFAMAAIDKHQQLYWHG